jgi:hypothetical protein
MNDNDMTSGSGKKPTSSRTKMATILLRFWAGARMTRFDAEHHHDHCLHSTISALERFGITFDRRWETVPCVGGTLLVRCKRYWLRETTENRKAASTLLADWGLI